jgi:hypothetical protein
MLFKLYVLISPRTDNVTTPEKPFRLDKKTVAESNWPETCLIIVGVTLIEKSAAASPEPTTGRLVLRLPIDDWIGGFFSPGAAI